MREGLRWPLIDLRTTSIWTGPAGIVHIPEIADMRNMAKCMVKNELPYYNPKPEYKGVSHAIASGKKL
jgi:hypothetical protein